MPKCSHPIRSALSPSTTGTRKRQPHPRPWPALPSQAQTQLAQQLARLVQRLHPFEEAGHADRAE
jgi:hypothetical protein